MISRRLLCVWIVTALATTSPLQAIEKDWFAHESDLIVVGTFRQWKTIPWIDGWHLRGEIEVEELLYGNPVSRRIAFRLICRWGQHRRWWPPPDFPSFARGKGLWFLRQADGDVWQPSLGEWDLGFRPLCDRDYWQDYIRRVKTSRSPARRR
jgi:hypothetical protein